MLILLLWQAQPQEAWVLWAFSVQAGIVDDDITAQMFIVLGLDS